MRAYDILGKPQSNEKIILKAYNSSESQGYPRAAALDDGNFVLVWTRNDSSGHNIYMQIFHQFGGKVTSELKVNSNSVNYHDEPHVAKLDSGDFVVAWRCSGCDGGDTIQARIFSEYGIGKTEFRVLNVRNHTEDPFIIPTKNKGFAITWTDNSLGDSNVYIRIFSASGKGERVSYRVNRYTDNKQARVSGARLKDGNSVLVWESHEQDGDGSGIYAKVYDEDFNLLEDVFLVNNYTDNHQRWPRVAALSDGGFFIVWRGFGVTDIGIFGKRYSSSWSPIGDDLLLNDEETVLGYTSIMTVTDDHFVVLWGAYDKDEDYSGITGKVFKDISSSDEEEYTITGLNIILWLLIAVAFIGFLALVSVIVLMASYYKG